MKKKSKVVFIDDRVEDCFYSFNHKDYERRMNYLF